MILKHSFLAILTLLVFSQCKSPTKAGKVDSLSEISYAKHFTIEKKKDQTILHIIDPDTKEIKSSISVSNKSEFNRIIALSSTQIGMIHQLQQIKSIVGVTDKKYIYNKELLQRLNQGLVVEVGEEGLIPLEAIIKAKTQLVLYSGFGNEFPHEKQLNKIDIQCIPIYDWREQHPLGKAEWIKFFGVLYDKEEEANAYFKKVEQKYHELKTLVKDVKTKPSVVSGHVFGDHWYAPSGENYFGILMKDAGMDYLYKGIKGSKSVERSLEQILIDTKNVEIWLDPNAKTKAELLQHQAKYAHLNMYQHGKIYGYHTSNNKYWENAAVSPDKVLSDLISIAHPNLISKTSYFYQEVK